MVTYLIDVETHTIKTETKIWFLHPLKTQLLMQRISPLLQKHIHINFHLCSEISHKHGSM